MKNRPFHALNSYTLVCLLVIFRLNSGCETKNKEPRINKGAIELTSYNGKMPSDSKISKRRRIPRAYGETIFVQFSIQEFPEFWRTFGKALQAKDSIQLDYCINDTLQFWGREDNDPRFTLTGRNRISKVQKIYKDGGYYEFKSDRSISYAELFSKRIEEIKDYKKGSIYQRVEDFAFENKGSGWKLVLVYCNTK